MTHAACITNALIWEGVSRYELRNRETILATMSKYGNGWQFVCDSFVGMSEKPHLDILDAMNTALTVNIKPVSLTSKVEVFALFAEWASEVTAPPLPRSPREWTSVGDVAYWLGHNGTSGPLRIAIEALLPRPLPKELNIQELSRFVSGRASIGDALFADWHGTEQRGITQMFLKETDSVHVVDDGHEVKVYYSVPLADSVTDGMPDAGDWNEQTMKRVRLLRLLLPNRETFGAQGLGLESLIEQMGHDPTFKCIPAKSLPMDRSVRLNAIFSSLVTYRLSRPKTWREYADTALAYREAVSGCFRKLHRGWAKLLSESPPKKNTIAQLPGTEIDQIDKLSNLLMFPRCAVDEWGFVSEEKQNKEASIGTMQERSLHRFNDWRKAFGDFESGVRMVVGKIIDLTVLYVAEHKGHVANDEDDNTGHLFLVNLGVAWKVLRPMQREFRERFGGLYSPQQLDELEMHERSNFDHLWSVAIAMRYERQLHLSNVGQMIETQFVGRRSQFLRSLQAEVNAVLGDCGTATVREAPWVIEGLPHLCIVSDYHNLEVIDAIAPRVVEAISRTAQAGGWRPLEWQPLEIEWPKIALVCLVRGKALLPACAAVSTSIFLAESEEFEVKQHHYAASRVDPEVFAQGGFRLWESPLLRATLELQGQLAAFFLTNVRYYELANLVLEYELAQSETDRILAGFSRELSIVLRVAQQSYSQMVQILSTTTNVQQNLWKKKLRGLCQLLLFTVEEDSSILLDLDSFVSWLDGFESKNDELLRLLVEIAAFALEEDIT